MSRPPLHLVLIGLRGSGKSTVARILAQRAGLPADDLDDRTLDLLRHARPDLPDIAAAFRELGEPAFRAAEALALRDALMRPPRILALGGGTPTAPGAADTLRAARRAHRARVVYLRADADTLRRRLAAAPMHHRPSLTGAPPLDEIDELLARRDPLYASLADLVLDAADAPTPDAAADAALAELHRP